jgi:hypothetical protein
MQRGGQSVDVRPWALVRGGELLDGSVARCENGRQCRAATHHGGSGCTEVDQRGMKTPIHDDVGRLDITMQEAESVDLF